MTVVNLIGKRILPLLLSVIATGAGAQEATDTIASLPETPAPLLRYEALLSVWGSTGTFAPYYIISNRGGRMVSSSGATLMLEGEREYDLSSRFAYGFGIEAIAGHQGSTDYMRWEPAKVTAGEWDHYPQTPAPLWLQQFWGGVKWRGVFIEAGMRQRTSGLFNSRLGSGDLVLSDDARPVPRLSAGFVDFQDIPLTGGFLQIGGELSWGKFIDKHWLEDRYNYYNSFLTTGAFMHYARCHFRTNPLLPFSVTIGMQHAAQFGGTTTYYRDGVQYKSTHNKAGLKDFVNSLFPWTGGDSSAEGDAAFYDGNHLGSWDVRLRYRLQGGEELTAYMQSPWEDGSGIGKLNGFDAVWGVEYRSADRYAILSGALAEYIDFTNQSGPMHWAPGDFPGTQVGDQATGADDYYNNFMYNGWANYGMALGNPFCVSPVYNLDGYMRFLHNRVRGFQVGAEGWLSRHLEWRSLLSFRTSWGTPLAPAAERVSDTSMLLGGAWHLEEAAGLRLALDIAWDAGRLLGNNFGVLFTVSYSGLW